MIDSPVCVCVDCSPLARAWNRCLPLGVIADVVQADVQGTIAEFCVACQGVDHAIRVVGVYLGVETDDVVSLGVDNGISDHGVCPSQV